MPSHTRYEDCVACDERYHDEDIGRLRERDDGHYVCRERCRGQQHDRTRTDGYLFWKPMNDGMEVTVVPMIFGEARLIYGEQGPTGAILDGFCYEDPDRAIEAAAVWTGEGDPLDGWHRNPFTGRRRTNADPAQEHVAR